MTEQTLRRSNWPAAPDAGRRTHDLPANNAGEDPLAELERIVMRGGPFGEPRQPAAPASAPTVAPPSNVEPFPARREPTFSPVQRAQPAPAPAPAAPAPAAALADNPFGIDEAAFETALRGTLPPAVTRAEAPAPQRPAPAPMPDLAPVRPVEARREPTLSPIRPTPQPAAPAVAAPAVAAQPASPALDPQNFDLDPQFLQALDRELFGQDRPAPPPAPRFDRYADALDGPYDDNAAQQEQPAPHAAQDPHEADAYADNMYEDDPRYTRDAPLPPVDEPEPELAERPRRRAGLITVVSVVGLVIAGGAGAVAYTVLTGGARQPAGEPPVVRADNRPTRVVPAQQPASTNEPGKIIFDRLGGQQPNPAGERLVAREEQPVAAINQPRVDPRPVPTTTPGGIAEPRRVTTTTIRVRADGTLESEPTRGGTPPASAPRAAAPAPVTVPQVPPTPAPSTLASLQSAEPARRATADDSTAAAPPPPMPLPRPANAPSARTAEPAEAAAPVRQAAIQPPQAQAQAQTQTQAPAANGRGPFVQVASQRSEDAARSTYADLQRRFPQLLGDRQPNIQSISIPDRGTFWRVRVGGFGSRDDAAQFCTRFRTAGGECVIAAN